MRISSLIACSSMGLSWGVRSHPRLDFRFLSQRFTNLAQVSISGLSAINCLIRQPLAFASLHGECGALHVINAKLGAGVLAEIELGQIPIKMLFIDVLVHADESALHDAEKAFERVHMHVATRPFKLGMIDAFMCRNGRVNVVLRLIGDEAAILVDVGAQVARHAAMIENDRTGIPAALDKTQNDSVRALTS